MHIYFWFWHRVLKYVFETWQECRHCLKQKHFWIQTAWNIMNVFHITISRLSVPTAAPDI